MALREKQIQQNYRPIIGVHKWFAPPSGNLVSRLILSEFAEDRLEDTFFRSNDLSDFRIADPFMGGGTPLIEGESTRLRSTGFRHQPDDGGGSSVKKSSIWTSGPMSKPRAFSSTRCVPKSANITAHRVPSTARPTYP